MLDYVQRGFPKHKERCDGRMNNPYFISIIGFILMAFSAGWLGLATFLGVPFFTIVGVTGVILFAVGIGIVIYMLSSIRNIKVVIEEE